MSMKEWTAQAKLSAGQPQVDYATHKPTDGELNNITFLSMKYLIGWGMRAADLAVVLSMAGSVATVSELDEKFAPVLAEYMWDHLAGEPDDLAVEDLTEAVCVVRDLVYGLPEYERNAV